MNGHCGIPSVLCWCRLAHDPHPHPHPHPHPTPHHPTAHIPCAAPHALCCAALWLVQVSMLDECRSVDRYEKLNRINEGTYGVVYRYAAALRSSWLGPGGLAEVVGEQLSYAPHSSSRQCCGRLPAAHILRLDPPFVQGAQPRQRRDVCTVIRGNKYLIPSMCSAVQGAQPRQRRDLRSEEGEAGEGAGGVPAHLGARDQHPPLAAPPQHRQCLGGAHAWGCLGVGSVGQWELGR